MKRITCFPYKTCGEKNGTALHFLQIPLMFVLREKRCIMVSTSPLICDITYDVTYRKFHYLLLRKRQ